MPCQRGSNFRQPTEELGAQSQSHFETGEIIFKAHPLMAQDCRFMSDTHAPSQVRGSALGLSLNSPVGRERAIRGASTPPRSPVRLGAGWPGSARHPCALVQHTVGAKKNTSRMMEEKRGRQTSASGKATEGVWGIPVYVHKITHLKTSCMCLHQSRWRWESPLFF